MKTLKELLEQPAIYLHNWEDKEDMINDFEDLGYVKEDNPKHIESAKKYEKYNILFASYGTGNYEGDAFVLLEQDGKLYEVNGSHCSCYGLEGQFDLEEIDLISIKERILEGNLGTDDYAGNVFATELKAFLGIE
jgi:hypothetical protein